MSRPLSFVGPLLLALAACGSSSNGPAPPAKALDPATAPVVAVDRFSPQAGHLFVRTASNGLPAANEPIHFDQGPFITQGLGPDGRTVTYYNLDVMPLQPAPIYVLFRDGDASPVAGQLNIVDVVPGDTGYSDFWQVMKVTVPQDYAANSATSLDEIEELGYRVEPTPQLVNCPVVPDGSTAMRRFGAGESAGLMRGWYRGQVVTYFTFAEKALSLAGGQTPVSGIWVTFRSNPNPADPASGPASGFVIEPGSAQTHNITESVPGDAGYSPLWSVNPYHNADFGLVGDLRTARRSEVLATGVALVNCPIVSAGAAPRPTYRDISTRDALRLLERMSGTVVIDVSPHHAEGHLPTARSYPLGTGSLDAAIPSLDPAGEYLVYCHADGPSIAGSQKLIDAGFATVYRLVGNYRAWVDAGYPVER